MRKVIEKKGKKCRGNKIRKPYKRQTRTEIISNHKTFKFLGYCKNCGGQIVSGDLESKKIYVCPQCSNRNSIGKLKKDKNIDKPTTKKDYLENTINSDHIDAPYIAKEDVPPEILKKFEEGDL